MNLKSLPKIELHLHLEGAAPANFIKNLATQKHIDVSKIFNQLGQYQFDNFKHFLSVYEAATTVLQSPDDFYKLTKCVLEECAKNHVVYVETFVSPEFCGGNDIVSWKEYLSAICEASEESEASFGIISRGIATCIRHLGPNSAKDTAKCAVETGGEWLVGFGMAGDETFGQSKDYVYSFDLAREAGLKLTSHAGEWGGSESVRSTVNQLGVQRVGHGVQSINDDELIQSLIEQQIVLEVCPGSNVFLGLYPDLQSHPIKTLRDRGVMVTVSTDDPPFFQTSMDQEYESLASCFGWSEDDFLELNRVALDAAFCDKKTKEKIAKMFKF